MRAERFRLQEGLEMFRKSLVGFAISVLGSPAFAVDSNFTAPPPDLGDDQSRARLNLCEQLLNADLSGHYVATNLTTGRSALVELRPLGSSRSFAIHTLRLNLPATGFRELEFERAQPGWLIDESTGARVNILSWMRAGSELLFRFESSDDAEAVYLGMPLGDERSLQGDLLKPLSWTLRFRDGFESDVRFTRVVLDRAFETTASQSLKSQLATRLHDENSLGRPDSILVVEMKRPMTLEEACNVLETPAVCPLEPEDPGRDGRSYRFGVGLGVYGLLESMGHWVRHWEIVRVDILHLKLLSPDFMSRLNERIKLAASSAAQVRGPARSAEQAPRPAALSGPFGTMSQTPPRSSATTPPPRMGLGGPPQAQPPAAEEDDELGRGIAEALKTGLSSEGEAKPEDATSTARPSPTSRPSAASLRPSSKPDKDQ